MPRKVCVAAGCDDLAIMGKSHCPDHEQHRRDQLAERRATAQLTEHAASWRVLYQSRDWRKAARRFLSRNPLCSDCAELGAVVAATQVDHITPHKGDLKLFWHRKNWQPLCQTCHSRKTAHEVFHPNGGLPEN